MKYRLFGEEHWVEAIDREATHRQRYYTRIDIGNEHLSTYGGEPGTFAALVQQAGHVLYRLRSYADESGNMRTMYELPTKFMTNELVRGIIATGGRVENIEAEAGLYIEVPSAHPNFSECVCRNEYTGLIGYPPAGVNETDGSLLRVPVPAEVIEALFEDGQPVYFGPSAKDKIATYQQQGGSE